MNKLLTILILITCSLSFAQRNHVISRTNSLVGNHTLSHPTLDGLPIFNYFIKENKYQNQNRIHKSQSELVPLNRKVLAGDQIISENSGYILQEERYTEVKAIQLIGNDGISYTLYINNKGETIHHLCHNYYANDTIVGTVFMPDPITSSGNNYGAPYYDNHDQYNDELNAELQEVLIKATFNEGQYQLENEHLKIVNNSSPDISPSTLSDSIFKFNRAQMGFEEIMAMYHITHFAEYIKDTLGFTTLMNYAIDVDVYALNGADNSEFISSTVPPRLNFGQGGVDDAEDADILIHEYGHAVSHSAAPGSFSGYENLAMDEGFGDYWAAVYSKRINNNNYKDIFNWDGHNEFWSGRSIDHDRKYSDGLDGNKYVDGELFAATLIDIRNTINDSIVDVLVLQSAYAWYPMMTMEDAMREILSADTLLFDNEYSPVLVWKMCERGFLGDVCLNSINEIAWKPQLDYTLLNQGYLKISNLTTFEIITIYSANGQLVRQETSNQNPINLNNLSSGIYIINIKGKSIKIRL